jgi:hypothetical protein
LLLLPLSRAQSDSLETEYPLLKQQKLYLQVLEKQQKETNGTFDATSNLFRIKGPFLNCTPLYPNDFHPSRERVASLSLLWIQLWTKFCAKSAARGRVLVAANLEVIFISFPRLST